MRRGRFGAVAAALIAVTVGCDDLAGPAELAGALSADEADALAVGFADLGGEGEPGSGSEAGAGSFAILSGEPIHRSGSFSVSRSCPLGGSVHIDGAAAWEIDRESRTVTGEISAIKTHEDCVLPARGTEVTVNGNPDVALERSVRRVNGAPDGPQTLTQEGSIRWSTADGREGACDIELTSTWDPDSRTMTVQGTVCGRDVDATRTRG